VVLSFLERRENRPSDRREIVTAAFLILPESPDFFLTTFGGCGNFCSLLAGKRFSFKSGKFLKLAAEKK
jgi:hypothetical protein